MIVVGKKGTKQLSEKTSEKIQSKEEDYNETDIEIDEVPVTKKTGAIYIEKCITVSVCAFKLNA